MNTLQHPSNIIKTYTIPRLHTGKCWYISFSAFDPHTNKLRLKRIKLNSIKKVSVRRQYAEDLICELHHKLRNGWSPWMDVQADQAHKLLSEALENYNNYIEKLHHSDIIREKTIRGYKSMCKIFSKWNDEQVKKVHYCFQLTPGVFSKFLDHLWIDRELSTTTRNNYLTWIKNLCKFLQEKEYTAGDPSQNLKNIGKNRGQKNRTVISQADMQRLKDYALEHNKYFLLACYILYYCFIRPKEMSNIKLKHISVRNGTIFIPAETSKNRKDGIVTLPNNVLELMIDLNIFNHPSEHYLFSDSMRPGQTHHSSKQFTDYWSYHIKKDLHFPDEYKFYSLKDTGITDLIISNTDLVSVRNQARHHSLTMTDIYTPRDQQHANEILKNRKGNF